MGFVIYSQEPLHVDLRVHQPQRVRRAAAVAVLPPHHLHADRPVPGPDRAAQHLLQHQAQPVQGEQGVPRPAARGAQRQLRHAEVRTAQHDQDTRLHPRRHDVHQSPRRLRHMILL